MAKGVWGIDVSKSSIKAVRIEQTKDGLTLTDIEVVPYKSTGRVEESDLEGRMKEALKDLKYSRKIGGERVAISLPTHSAFNRLIKLPPVDDPVKAVQYEAQSQIPFPLDQVVWGYQIIDRQYQPGEEKEVTLIALKKDIVEQFLANIQEVHLNIECVQLSPVALYNFLAFDQDMTAPTIILDMGADNSSLIVMENERFWIRNLPITGNDLTKALQDKFSLNYEKADALKLKATQSQQVEKIYEALVPVYKNIVSEIHRSLGYYKSMSRLARFDRVLLLGNGTKALNFQRFITQALQIQATRIQKLNNIALSDGLDPKLLSNNLQSLGTAVGLALQGLGLTKNRVNLLPPQFLVQKEQKKKYPAVVGIVALLYVAVILLYMNASDKVSKLEGIQKAVQDTISQADQLEAEFQMAKNNEQLIQDISRIASLATPRDSIQTALKAVYDNLPNNGDPNLADKDKIWVVQVKYEVKQKPRADQSRESAMKVELSRDRLLVCEVHFALTRWPRKAVVVAEPGEQERRTDDGAKFIEETVFNPAKFKIANLVGGKAKVTPAGTLAELRLPTQGPGGGSGNPSSNADDIFQRYIARFEIDLNPQPEARKADGAQQGQGQDPGQGNGQAPK